MRNTSLKKASRVLDVAVFVFTTMAIAGVFYEGMTLKWYDIVGVLVVCMDYTFMPATILHLIVDRKDKWIALHIFSMVLIIAAVVMKIGGIPYPAITLLFWYFYLWFLYGSILIRMYISARE
ncbi:MAG: hypothetical protein IJH11_01725 [Lachnospiraceae bacterium]|nr:hypothetical protein [Lachnospiraceae bacterium]